MKQPAPSSRRWRRLGWAFLALLIVGFAAAEWAGWPFLRRPVEFAASRALSQPVRLLGEFRIRLIGDLELCTASVSVGEATWISITDACAKTRWTEAGSFVFGRQMTVDKVQMGHVQARIENNSQGLLPWQKKAVSKAPADAAPWGLRIGQISLEKAEIEYLDAAAATLLVLRLSADESRSTVGVVQKDYRGDLTGRWKSFPIRLNVRTPQSPLLTSLSSLSLKGQQIPVEVAGSIGRAQLSFEGALAATDAGSPAQGRFSLSGPSLADVGTVLGVTLPRTAPFELVGLIKREGSQWNLDAERFQVGQSRLNGVFTFVGASPIPHLSGSLKGKILVMSDLQPLIAGSGAPALPARAGGAGQRVFPDRSFDLPSLTKMEADVDIAIGSLQFGATDLKPLSAVRTQLSLKQGVLRLDNFFGNLAGGKISGNSELNANDPSAVWKLDVRMTGVNVSEWIPALQGNKPSPSRSGPEQNSPPEKPTSSAAAPSNKTPYLTGLLSVQAQVQGRGRSSAQILGSLDGTLKARLERSTMSHLVTELMGLDVAQVVGLWIRGDKSLQLSCARAEFQVKNGLATLRRGVIDNSDSTIEFKGDVDLATEKIDMLASVRPKDFSPLSLRSPLLVKGSLASPSVGLDAGPLVAKVAAGAALAAVAGPAGLLPFLDAGASDHPAPCVDVPLHQPPKTRIPVRPNARDVRPMHP